MCINVYGYINLSDRPKINLNIINYLISAVINMGIQLTPNEMELVKQGKLDPNKIEEYRKLNPVQTVKIDTSEINNIKEEIRIANLAYREAISRNKELYDELIANRKRKEECRLKIGELRAKKKKLLGIA